MEYFDVASYKCRTGRDDVLCTRMTILVGFGGTFVFVLFFLKNNFLLFFLECGISKRQCHNVMFVYQTADFLECL